MKATIEDTLRHYLAYELCPDELEKISNFISRDDREDFKKWLENLK